MSGKFINTEHRDTIDGLVTGLKEIMNNPYYKWNDKSGTPVIYFNQNKEASTLDQSSKLYYADIGIDSPIKYNMIEDFMIYGIDQIAISMENGDFGVEASEISGEAIILPNTIIPYPGDYFHIIYTEEKLLFRVIDATPDTLENGSNIYKIQYKLESSQLEDVIESDNIEDKYNMIVNNLGTGFNPIIRHESYNMIKALDKVLYDLRMYYKSVFYKSRVQTFIFSYNNQNFYDPYMIEFLKENKILDGSEDYIYLTQQVRLSSLFPMQYDKSFFKCVEEKDLQRLRWYNHNAIAEYIDDPLSIFQTRLENYYQIKHQTCDVNFGIIPCFKDELINAIEDDVLLDGNDSVYNIIIKYFRNKPIDQMDIDNLKLIDYSDNVIIFYAIPCIIYCLERFAKSLMMSQNEHNGKLKC